jgi:aminopeptidase N
MYDKGSNMIHTIRQVINNDNLFKQIVRGINKDFYHKTVSSSDIEQYFSRNSQMDLSRIFDQYLRTIRIPVLEWKKAGHQISFRWTNCINGFNMPVKLKNGTWLSPTTQWKIIPMSKAGTAIDVDRNFYIETKKV